VPAAACHTGATATGVLGHHCRVSRSQAQTAPGSHRIALAQFDFPVGAISANAQRIAELARRARDQHGAGLLVLPELALCGYPPEDLLFRDSFLDACDAALAELAADIRGIDVVIGHPLRRDGHLYNAVSWLRDGAILATGCKQALPNYGVFDELRWFHRGQDACLVDWQGLRVGVLICEDVWAGAPVQRLAGAGAQLIMSINASPFEDAKSLARRDLLRERVAGHGCAMAYVNCVGGQDELVFDGGSLLIDADGREHGPARAFTEDLLVCDYQADNRRWQPPDWQPPAQQEHEAVLWAGLVRGLADYVAKNGFSSVLLGASGGMDSAFVMALAADAVGGARVHAVAMPSRYTAGLSNDLARQQAQTLGARFDTIAIEPAHHAFLDMLAPAFAGRAPDLTEENIQARCRGLVLMALSNKFGGLLLATGNKSEMAVGYSTLYGDLCGGYAPIKDCWKTLIYRLAHWRNRQGDGEVIPQAVIDRPPSAELREGQLDQDSLPPYEQLDAILHRHIELGQSAAQIVAAGFEMATVEHIIGLVRRAEYKRRQAPPGPKISLRAFGRDRRYPMTLGWR